MVKTIVNGSENFIEFYTCQSCHKDFALVHSEDLCFALICPKCKSPFVAPVCTEVEDD